MDAKWTPLCFVLLFPAVLCADFSTLNHLKSKVDPDTQGEAVVDLAYRILGDNAKYFQFVVDPSLGPANRDTFTLVSLDNLIAITGTTGVACAWGFSYYLKKFQGFHFSWAGDQVKWQGLVAVPDPGIMMTSNDKFRYYQNVCTSSYSFAWWNWTRWEKEIDWMALSGINLPLAFTGQESIWQKVYGSLGLTPQDLQSHFGGPAYLAWARMGNIRGWGGPLPQSWLDQQLQLQKQIVQRMRLLGMIPVLPGFAGHIPRALINKFPKANYTKLGNWQYFNDTFSGTYLLDPQDPLFARIGKLFIQQMITEFNGTDHIYNADTFNEMLPKSSDPVYIKNIGSAVYNGMVQGDPNAIWLMQGWLFLAPFWKPPQAQALLTSVPQGKMIILDLRSELYPQFPRLKFYYGQPFIWCMLHNFGGVTGMHGDMQTINSAPMKARVMPNSTMVGIGITPEGINTNDVVYEFMLENIARTKPDNLTAWFMNYAERRYGAKDANAAQGWLLLKQSIYNCTNGNADFSRNNIPTQRPMFSQPNIWYNTDDLFHAWDYFVSAINHLKDSALFRYDLVDVTRQSLQIAGLKYYADTLYAFQKNQTSLFDFASNRVLQLIKDMDVVLGTDPHFLMGAWIEDAKRLATTQQERDLYEYNARIQVTTWGPNGEILDYANKQWSGLISDYYYPRWKLFFSVLKACMAQGTPYNPGKYNQDVFNNVEKPFTTSHNALPNITKGVTVDEVLRIYNEYRPAMNDPFFSQLPRFSSKGKKFMKYAKFWMKENDVIKKWKMNEKDKSGHGPDKIDMKWKKDRMDKFDRRREQRVKKKMNQMDQAGHGTTRNDQESNRILL